LRTCFIVVVIELADRTVAFVFVAAAIPMAEAMTVARTTTEAFVIAVIKQKNRR
jgi:hypothetical protein